jgi:hypothetical protein
METERAILASGLLEWGGPATPTDELARLLGFADVQSQYNKGRAIAWALRSGEPLTAGATGVVRSWRLVSCAASSATRAHRAGRVAALLLPHGCSAKARPAASTTRAG